MPPEQRLSTQERLRLARRRRSEQLKKWGQREREWQLHIAAQNHPRERNERITFVPNVMLLEAAARNDLEEGRPQQFFRHFSVHRFFVTDFFSHRNFLALFMVTMRGSYR